MINLSPELINQVADLARLELNADDVAKYQQQMQEILQYVERLQELDLTAGTDGSMMATEFVAEREDEVAPSLDIEDILANAPKKVGSAFQVPKIIE